VDSCLLSTVRFSAKLLPLHLLASRPPPVVLLLGCFAGPLLLHWRAGPQGRAWAERPRQLLLLPCACSPGTLLVVQIGKMEDADAIGRRRRLLLHETDRIEQAPLFLFSVLCRWRSAEGSRGARGELAADRWWMAWWPVLRSGPPPPFPISWSVKKKAPLLLCFLAQTLKRGKVIALILPSLNPLICASIN
jgi:hypothetical protein